MSNIHLLVRVPSFARWPLRLHFLARDAHAAWEKWCATANEPMRPGFPVMTDFESPAPRTVVADSDAESETECVSSPRGIHALPLDYMPIKGYVEKGKEVFDFEREGKCVVCTGPMATGQGIYALCTNTSCEGVGHLSCWSRHMLPPNEKETIIPLEGKCPKCQGHVRWGDMMTELTMRLRGAKEVDKLLGKKRKAKA